MDEAVALGELAHFHWLQGNLNIARQLFERMLRVGQLRSSATLCEAAWNNLAVIHRDSGNAAHAMLCQQQAAKSLLNLPDSSHPSTESISCQLANRANDAILARDFRLAERLLRSALAHDRHTKNESGEADGWGSLGIVASLTGNIARARQRFLRAYRIHTNLGDDRGGGNDLKHLAELALLEDDLPAARRHINLALAHFERAACAGLFQIALRTSREIAGRERVADFDPTRN